MIAPILIAEYAAAALSLLLMGACGAGLLLRLVNVLRGREAADRMPWEAPNSARRAPLRGPGSSPRACLIAAGVTLGSRLLLFVFAYALYRGLRIGDDGFWQSLEPLWTHWDVRHYVGIAQSGYTAVGDDRLRLVFFPLYPLLMRLLSPMTGGRVFLSGTLLSLLCASASGALLYDLCRTHWDDKTAGLALAYFLLNPLSVFLCCVYTEALFLCLTLAAVWLLRRNHPWLAALCGAASAFTRMPGLIIAGLFFIRLLGKWPREQNRVRAALCCAGQMALVLCGLLLYLAVNWVVTGDPFMYATYQIENWYQAPGSFWASTANTVHYFLTVVGESDWLFTWGFQLIAMLYAYALLAARLQRLPFDLAAYSFVYVAVVFAPTWLLSGARYLYALCALPMLQARAHEKRLMHGVALGVCACLLAVWTFGFTIGIQVL